MGWLQDAGSTVGGAVSNAANSSTVGKIANASTGGMIGAYGSIAQGKNPLPSWITDPTGKDAAKAAQDKAVADAAAGEGEYVKTAGGITDKMSSDTQKYVNDIAGIQGNTTAATKGAYGDYTNKRDSLNSKQNTAQQTYAGAVGSANTQYAGAVKGVNDTFANTENQLSNQAQNQATSAQADYTNNIQPQQKNLMERAAQNAGKAMSLSDAGNMNNQVASGVRNFYNTEAQNEGNQGLASSGVLAALGAQATAGAMGAGQPLTGAQLQLLGANNQSQAGQAYAATQQRMQSLRDQGINQGLAQSNLIYQQGQNAQQLATGQTQAYQQGGIANAGLQQGLRGEQSNYGQNIQSANRNTADIAQQTAIGTAGVQNAADQQNYATQLGNTNQDVNFTIGQIQNTGNQQIGNAGIGYTGEQNVNNINLGIAGQKAGYTQGAAATASGIAAANQAQNTQILGSVIGAGGTIAGAALGGPAGAVAGGAVGKTVGEVAAPQEEVPQEVAAVPQIAPGEYGQAGSIPGAPGGVPGVPGVAQQMYRVPQPYQVPQYQGVGYNGVGPSGGYSG